MADTVMLPKELIERLTKWRLCMSYNDSYFGEPAGELKRITHEIERAIESRVLAERKDPVAWADRHDLERMRDGTLTIAGAGAKQHPDNVPLFTHPTPDDASGPAITADVHADAARYRWLRGEGFDRPAHMWVTTLSDQKPIVHTDLDAAIDRARQSGEEGK